MKVAIELSRGAAYAVVALLAATPCVVAGTPQPSSAATRLATAPTPGASSGTAATAARSLPVFDKLQADWNGLHDYSVTIESHEVLGDSVSDHELHYAFRKPHQARLDVVTGTKSGSTMLWDGGDTVTAFHRALSFFKIHRSPWATDVTSLRGNGIINPDMGDIVGCFNTYRGRLKTHNGPMIDGQATEQISLPYSGVTCPDDSVADKAVTLDVLDLAKSTGLILRRERYVGDQLVERFDLKDYKIDTVSDADLR